MIFRSENPDPFALGKYQHYTKSFRITTWVFFIFSFLVYFDPYLSSKYEDETILELQEGLEQVKVGGKYGGYIPRSYFDLTAPNLDLRLSAFEAVSLELKPGDQLRYHCSLLFRQRLLLAANGQIFTYHTYGDGEYKKLLLWQGCLAFIGLIGFLPGQVRQKAVIISGLLSLLSLLKI